MSIALDLIIVLILGLTFFLVVKKGFVRTVIDFASVICALIFSKLFTPVLSSIYYDGLYGTLADKTEEMVTSLIEQNSLPELLQAEQLTEFLSKYQPGLAEELNVSFIKNSAHMITKPIIALLAYGLAFLTIFILTLILFKIISVLAGGIFELPFLKQVNKAFAFIPATLLSILYVVLFIALMQLLVPFISSVYPDVINADIIDKTYIFGYLYNLEWLEIFVN